MTVHDSAVGIENTAKILPSHYASENDIARALRLLGKPKAAAYIEGKLPTWLKAQSGDVGEILATEFIEADTPYRAPIRRLRWRDDRNMAMRGDDVIAVHHDDEAGSLRFLKTEAKSRVTLNRAVVSDARKGLGKDEELPLGHSLAFIIARLLETGSEADEELSDAIRTTQLKHGIRTEDVRHLLFVVTGNKPDRFLTADLETYEGVIPQMSVGLRVEDHTSFVQAVFQRVIDNGDDREP